MEIKLLSAQLRRMRAMDYKYHALFFRWINFWIVIVVGLFVVSLLEPLRLAAFFIAPLVLYAAVQGAFHFHYMLFARRLAGGLEQRLNAAVGNKVLIASELEDAVFFKLDAPRFVGFSFGSPTTLFSGMTLHYGIGGTILWALGLGWALAVTPQYAATFPLLWLYAPALLVWTIINIAFLGWYFVARRDEKSVQKILDRFAAAAA